MTDRYMEAGWSGAPIDFHFVMDTHGHLGQTKGFLILDSGHDGMLKAMDQIGINLTAISSIGGTVGGWTRGNDAVIAAVQDYPNRFFGYITVNGYAPEAVQDECTRCWEGGCRGLKLHTSQGLNYDRPELRPALEFANEKGCPILCHVWGWELDHMQALFREHPQSHWILAHAGSAEKEKYIETVKTFDNTSLEICFSRCPKGMIESFVDEGLEDRVLFGSDADFIAASQQIGRVLFAEISEEAKKKILCDNPRKVFQLEA